MNPTLMHLSLESIRRDPDLQSRAEPCCDALASYTELLADPAFDLPPVAVFHDGATYWLADGWHRMDAYAAAGRTEIPAQIHDGTRRDALRYALSANATHGLSRTRMDKERAVQMALADPEWCQWSDREIARLCAVSHTFVARTRRLPGSVPGVPIACDAGNVAKKDVPGSQKPATQSTQPAQSAAAANGSAEKKPSLLDRLLGSSDAEEAGTTEPDRAKSQRVTVTRDRAGPDDGDVSACSWQEKALEGFDVFVNAVTAGGCYDAFREEITSIRRKLHGLDDGWEG